MARRKNMDSESEAALSVAKAELEQEGAEMAAQEQRLMNIAAASELIGIINAMNFIRSLTEITVLMKLRELKDSKKYKELGFTWAQVCEKMSLSVRTVDDKLSDLAPFSDDFLGRFADFFSNDFRKIKYLGRAVIGKAAEIDGNAIAYRGQRVEVSDGKAGEIQEILDQIQEDLVRQIEEKDAALRVQKRLAKSKEDVIKKMEQALKRLEKKVDLEELTGEEVDALNILEQVQTDFLQGVTTVKKNIPYDAAPEIALRRLYFLYIFMSKVCMEERLALHELYKDADEVPWEITDEELPPPGVLETETPLTAGLKKKGKRG